MKRHKNTPRYTNLKEEKNLMKNKNNLLKFTNIVLFITMIAIILVSGTYAKYTSTVSGTSATVVANWSFNVNDKNIAAQNTFEFNLFDTANILDSDGETAETDVAKGLIAPGTSGAFKFALKNTSDVTAKYEINLEVKDTNNIPLEFSFDGKSWEDDLTKLLTTDVMGIGSSKDVIVKWRWPFGDTTVTDATLGGKTVTIDATITATQVNNSDLEYIDKESLKILAIGNSFSMDSMEYAYQIAENLGYESVTLGNLYIGGCTLETHLTNANNDSASYTYYTNTNGTWTNTKSYKMSAAIQSEEWDYITFQQASGDSGVADTYDDLSALIEIVKPMSGNAKLAWHMTWAYQANSTQSGFANYNNNQMTMYNAIVSAVQEKIETNNNIDIIIPVGTAIQNARTSYLGDTLTKDGYHLSYDMGRYIAGVTFISKLTGLDPSNITYVPDGLATNLNVIAIEAANNAIKNPYQITNSSYDDESKLGYTLLDLELVPYAFYSSASAEKYYEMYTLEDSPELARRFVTTKRKFTIDDIPIGSIIEIADGFQYRPDGWINAQKNPSQSSRPEPVQQARVVVDSNWWGNWTERVFNIELVSGENITDEILPDVYEALKIYVPKN